MMAAHLLLAVSATFVASAAFFFALGLSPRLRLVTLLALAVPISLSPLLIPPHARFLRFLASVTAVMLLAKLYDLHLSAGRGLRPQLRHFLALLPCPFCLVLRKLDSERQFSRRQNLIHLTQAVVGLLLGTAVLVGVFQLDWSEQSFALEHCAKVFAFFFALIPTTMAAAAVWRLFVGKAREVMDHPYFARTPNDFWRRYNRPAQQFFYEDVFKSVGARRFPLRATVITFGVSALIHEYVFAIPVGRVQGYQTLFFMIQGFAVAATMRVRPNSMTTIPWIVGTLLFNLASSVLFFASLNGVVPFYSHGVPSWLQW
jgi:hypothetical protein